MEINEKLQIAKQGVNLIRTIADENNCFFHEIQQENDVGIDAIIELSQHNHLTGTNIAVQIKTGNSYIDKENSTCSFPIGRHASYWMSHDLPVYGLVCDLERRSFYFVDIKSYLLCHKEDIANGSISAIRFDVAYFNTINSETFMVNFSGKFLT